MPIPLFLQEQSFALKSSKTSLTVLRTHRHVKSALSAISSHGSSVAQTALLLGHACRIADEPRFQPPLPSALLLSDLRAILFETVTTGTARNARRRVLLRRAVAAVVFADAMWPRRYHRRVCSLEGLAGEESAVVDGEARRLRVVVRAIQQALNDVVEAALKMPLSAEVWEEIDELLTDAIRKRNEGRGGEVDAACVALQDAVEKSIMTARISIELSRGAGMTKGIRSTSDDVKRYVKIDSFLRGGGVVSAELAVERSCKDGCEQRTVLTSKLENMGESELQVSGVSISTGSNRIIVPVYAKLPTQLQPRNGPPAFVEYSSPLRALQAAGMRGQSSDDFTVTWFVTGN